MIDEGSKKCDQPPACRKAKKRTQMNDTKSRKHAAASFFNNKAVFDSVWHDGLICKCNDLRLPQFLSKYLISFLDWRSVVIELDNTISRLFYLKRLSPSITTLTIVIYYFHGIFDEWNIMSYGMWPICR